MVERSKLLVLDGEKISGQMFLKTFWECIGVFQSWIRVKGMVCRLQDSTQVVRVP